MEHPSVAVLYLLWTSHWTWWFSIEHGDFPLPYFLSLPQRISIPYITPQRPIGTKRCTRFGRRHFWPANSWERLDVMWWYLTKFPNSRNVEDYLFLLRISWFSGIWLVKFDIKNIFGPFLLRKGADSRNFHQIFLPFALLNKYLIFHTNH